MFLEIVCFMFGHLKEVAIEIWKLIGYYASIDWSFNRLIENNLVKVDVYKHLAIYDFLQDMG